MQRPPTTVTLTGAGGQIGYALEIAARSRARIAASVAELVAELVAERDAVRALGVA